MKNVIIQCLTSSTCRIICKVNPKKKMNGYVHECKSEQIYFILSSISLRSKQYKFGLWLF